MADKPRLLVIEREAPRVARQTLADHYEIVVVRSVARAMYLLAQGGFEGVFVDAGQLPAVRWAGLMLQSDEVLEAIADGVAVVDVDLRILWANPEFQKLADPSIDLLESKFYRALGNPEVLGPDPCPFTTATVDRATASTELRVDADHYLRGHGHAGHHLREGRAPDRSDPGRDGRASAGIAHQRHQ